MSISTLSRRVASLSVVGLVAGGLGVVGLASPATAAEQTYTCTVLGNPQEFKVNMSVKPAQVAAGKTVQARLNVKLTVPENLANAMRGLLGAKEVDGTADATTKVGKAAPGTTTITIPKTPTGTAGPITLAGTGPLGAVAAGKPGQAVAVQAEVVTVRMNLYTAEGVPAPFEIPCELNGTNTRVGAVTTAKAASRTAVQATYLARSKQIRAVASVKAGQGVTATGKARFVLKQGNKFVAARTVKLTKKSKATATFKGVTAPGAYTVVVRYTGSKQVKASQGRKVVRVR
ncbi:putative lipoprotein with Yx(FWY)xxD motif [Nocardioides massiliensis]|uniref:Lipoprotein with Yx(FWY)xxD motif n=3 Tax=Nocardioides massiliensis TaxID=1325935 RepID=A0ABT9NTM4_9ACTN|nr:DUF6801 domain-containing protein [Nocardioides massiliensis]MDP9823778.1 putative lipoprotein with Yx(FWY)xxD motif [Nocardioides massiliensis]